MKAFCLAIDLINPDKPPASLAFLAGVCESQSIDYVAESFNAAVIKMYDTDSYNKIYNKVKLNTLHEIPELIGPVLASMTAKISEFQPDVLLVTMFSYMQYPIALQLLPEIRKIFSGEIIAGGPGINGSDFNTTGITNGKKLLTAGLIDYYVLGEGDEILPKFLAGERNLIGLNSKKSLYESWVPQIDDLDTHYILPSYKKIDFSVYTNVENKSGPVLSINTSRGCVRSCSFCDVGKLWKKFRYRSGASVVDEILKINQDTGVQNFTIVDSLINGSLKTFNDFNERMAKIRAQDPKLRDFSYNGMFIVRDQRSHPESFFSNMAAAGCDSLAIGVETGSDRLRFDMNKKFTNADLDYHLEMCQKYKIRNNLLMFVGYPTETDADFEQTLIMLERYQHYLIDDTIIGMNMSGIFSILPGSPVYDQRHELGIEITGDPNSDRAQLNWHNANNPTLTVKNRILRDLEFRKKAAELRYPIPYSSRYLQYLKSVDADFIPMSD